MGNLNQTYSHAPSNSHMCAKKKIKKINGLNGFSRIIAIVEEVSNLGSSQRQVVADVSFKP